MNLPLLLVKRKHFKKSIISGIIYNLRKVLKFELSPQYLSQKLTKTLHLEVVLYMILTSFILFLGENFNMCIFIIRRVYATNKNKLLFYKIIVNVYSFFFFKNTEKNV